MGCLEFIFPEMKKIECCPSCLCDFEYNAENGTSYGCAVEIEDTEYIVCCNCIDKIEELLKNDKQKV